MPSRVYPVLICCSLLIFGVGCKKTSKEATSNQSSATTSQNAAETNTASSTAGQTAGGEAPAEEDGKPIVLGPGSPVQQEAMVKAKTLYLKGQLSEAEPVFAAIAKSEPISSPQVSAAIALGDIYTATGRPEKALALYDELLERVGDIGEVHLVVGRAYAAQQQTDRAIAAYKKALEISPTYIFLWVELGQLYGQKGDQAKSTEALLEYEKQIYAIAKALGDPEGTSLEERMHLIDVLSFVEDDKGTETLLEVATSDPDFEARAAASRALGEVRAVSARPILEQIAAKDGSDAVRAAAKDALDAMKDIATPGEGDVTAPTFVDDPEKLGKPASP
ncbi:MAG: tetratricopeptide repeat protein [Myxococcota bacterium]|nr:tetratricopeptide repeat protein [Myxococcota bacterium]MEC9441889.1 tetratricopeptide repeat protein [Myxococcota bacterium]